VAGDHHGPAKEGEFDLVELVRVAVLLAGNLGFDVAPTARTPTLPEIRALLPHAAQYRFDPDPVTMKSRISYKLEAFD